MKQLIFAHRGASGYAPENTLEAFELAVRQGADGIELDVHMTREGELVVAHDETIDRVADGSGAICEMTLAELKRYRFNRTKPEYRSARIPTLLEVFELVGPSDLMINVELKNSYIDYPGLEKAALELAAHMGMEDRVLYSSFNHHSLLRIKQLNPKAFCGMLYEAILIEPWKYASLHGMDALHPHFSEMNVPGEVQNAHALGLKVNVWTPNAPRFWELCLRAGADILITDFPDQALRFRDEFHKTQSGTIHSV